MDCKCPECGAVNSLPSLIGHADASEAVAVALEFTPIGRLLVRYLGLFRPRKRSLSFDRVAVLLNELLPQIKAGQIERNGKTYAAPLPYWKEALEQVLGRDGLTLPLKSHGYLLTIIAGMSERQEAQAEAKVEEEKRHRTPEQREVQHSQGAAPPPEFRKALDFLAGKLKPPGDGRSAEQRRQDQLKQIDQALKS